MLILGVHSARFILRGYFQLLKLIGLLVVWVAVPERLLYMSSWPFYSVWLLFRGGR